MTEDKTCFTLQLTFCVIPLLPLFFFFLPEDVRSWRGCGEEEAVEEEAMRKSVSPLPGNEGRSSASTTRVFGVPLEEVTRTHTISGHEVPALVKHIVDYIEEHGHLDLEGLFLVNGNAERVDWLRQRYDSGEEVELEKEADLASAVSLLRLFLQELPEPIIPTAIQGHILQLHQDYSNEEELCRNLKYLLQQLPQLNYGLLRFLCRFLASVASLQQESWNIGTLAAVFGPDIFHLSTEGEDIRDQESVSRVLAELLDNQEGLFDSEDDDVSTTNDYSSINEQITELLDDERCEAECEELPQDGEAGPAPSDSPQHTHSPDDSPAASSHLSPISILPADSAEIIHRTIRAAVEQHFFELKSSIDQDLSNYDSQGVSPAEPADQGCHEDEEQQTDPEDSPCDTEGETPLTQAELHIQQSQKDIQDSLDSGAALEESSGMDLDAEAVRDAENNINTARQDNQPCDMEQTQTDTISCDSVSCRCDQNANTSENNRNHLSPCQPNSGNNPHLQLFPDNQWEGRLPGRLAPSHGDKAANPKVLKWMTDLTKIRRQIKDAKHRAESELGPQTRPRSNTLPKSFGSTLDQSAYDAAVEVKGQRPTREETLELIQRRVKGKRQEDGWPDDIKKMTKEQLSCEKTVLQKNLLHYEGLHGRPVTREERLVVKPLYDRYRLVKQMLTRVSITPVTIKEEEEDERKEREGGGEEDEREEEREEDEEEEEEEEGESSGGEMQSPEVIMAVDLVTPTDGSMRSQNQPDRQSDCPMTAKMEEGSGRLALDLRLSSSNASSMPELLEQLWKARAEKKKLRKTIREFEENFYQHNGRNVQKEDRVPMLEEYREYKRIKAKLRLLEVLISKQDSSKSI
ncbi:Protein FAM13B [Nibea albiflora]|uniref:Protein FAM13B n=1 Tax=Nibea albiflora TaxID=240163 RepID=A0ACB7EQ13_NIBAL|nr:Protein FAM13B [Nibea albiflora]